jgi:hypothetical protein
MTPKTLRIQLLTLAPSAPLVKTDENKDDESTTKILDRERMARAVEITAATGAWIPCMTPSQVLGLGSGRWEKKMGIQRMIRSTKST